MSVLSEFEEDFTEGILGADDGLSTSIVYTPAGGTSLSILGILNRAEDLEDANWQAALQASATLYVRVSDVASPSYQDTVTADGDTWTVARKVSKAGGVWKLELRRDLRPTFRK
jgi:hypothetical protein